MRTVRLLAVAALLLGSTALLGAPAAQSAVNPVFTPPVVTGGTVFAVATNTRGDTLIAGSFTEVNGRTVNRIAVLNADGSLNEDFMGYNGTLPNLGLNNTAYSAVAVGDRFYVAGAFTSVRGLAAGRIVMLAAPYYNPSPAFGAGFNGTVTDLEFSAPNRLFAAGLFTAYQGSPVKRIAKVNAYLGNLDTEWATNVKDGTDTAPSALHGLSDGSLLVGGGFTAADDASGLALPRFGLAKYSPTGSLVGAFSPTVSGASYSVNAITTFPSGRIAVGGQFTGVAGQPRANIAILNADGTVPTLASTPTANASVNDLLTTSGGSVLAGGSFTGFGCCAGNRVARLLEDGSSGSEFTGTGAQDGTVWSLAERKDAQLVIGGSFISFDGVAGPVVTVTSAPSLPRLFNSLPGNSKVTVNWVMPYDASGGTPLTLGYAYWKRADAPINGYCQTTRIQFSVVTSVCTGLTNGKPHIVQIQVQNLEGKVSNPLEVLVIPRTVPGKVRTPSRTFPAAGKARVAWVKPVSNGGAAITQYQYCRANCGVAANWKPSGGTPPRTYVVLTGLTKGTSYTVRLRARNVAGVGPAIAYTFTQGK